MMHKPRKSGQKSLKAWKTPRGCYIIKAFFMSLKSSEPSKSAGIIMIHLKDTLELRRLKNWLPRNTTSFCFVRTLKPMWKDVMFVYLQKPSDISLTTIFNCYWSQLITRKTYLWILWRDCQSQPIGKRKAITWYLSSLIDSQKWFTIS